VADQYDACHEYPDHESGWWRIPQVASDDELPQACKPRA
jgi:hypothetical protein